jgi:hypothetical protein
MELTERQPRRGIVVLLACVLAFLANAPHAEVFHLAIIGASTIMGGAIALAALIAITNRRIF